MTRYSERAVSKVIGVVLMTAIVVALAATVAVMVTGFADSLVEPAPKVAFDTEYHEDVDDRSEFHPSLSGSGAVMVISHQAGDGFDPNKTLIVIETKDTVLYEDYWSAASTGQEEVVTASNSIYPYSPTFDDKRIRLIWEDKKSGAVLFEWEGPEFE